MSKLKLTIVALASACVLALTSCAPVAAPQNRAVVVVSGGGAVSPFTTPTAACKTGLAAGNTDTAIREYLLSQGKKVYTSPASDDWGVVVEPKADSFGAFGNCPEVLPEFLTVMSSGDINASGERLARFVTYLHDKYGVTDVDFVGHSNGGLYSRAAIRILSQLNAPVKVRSLTMLGTPNEGAFPTSYAAGEISLDECKGDPFCVKFLTVWKQYAGAADKGLNAEDTWKFTDGTDGTNGWNAAQAGYLDKIPVTLIGGSQWTMPSGNPKLWPFDGITPVYSALAQGVSDKVIPHRTCWSAPLTHSIFVSDFAGLGWQTAMTWNTESLKRINQAIDESDTALTAPNRQGC